MGRKSRRRKERVAGAGSAGVQPPPATAPARWNAAVFIALAVLTFAVFGQVASHSFLNYDDGQFIYENQHVRAGLNPPNVTWALTSAEIGWYPVTWVSHMVDVDLWDMRAGMHLLTNVLIHLLCACVLFLALQRMTAQTWRAAVVAALFAVHPMHVESVAWASERKDTLSTLFALLAILFYATDPRKRLLPFAMMAISLMAKQMYVTLPFVLLLLDFWPLRRMQGLRELRNRVVEKLPLFSLSIFGAFIAVVGQRNLNTVQSVAAIPLPDRLENAAAAYFGYLAKFFVPVRLAVLYPLQHVGASAGIIGWIALLLVSLLTLRLWNRAPYVPVGWFWFLGTLIPVIGIVQIGPQALADRYSYFPFIGLFLLVVWGASDLAHRAGIEERQLAAIGVVVIVILAVVAYRQVAFWQDSETLFEHTIAVTPPNPLAEYSLGQALEMTDPDRAITHLRRAIRFAGELPSASTGSQAQAHVGLGTALLMKARSMPPGTDRTTAIDQAIAENEAALSIDPNAPHAKNNLALARQWRVAASVR